MMNEPLTRNGPVNGKLPDQTSGVTDNELRELVANAIYQRGEALRRLFDDRRDYDGECGFPVEPTVDQYQKLYDRDPIAARACEVLPRECWQVQPTVYEEEDGVEPTEFEKAWDALGKDLGGEKSYSQDESGSVVWEKLLRADILSGIGQYGVILLGLNDGQDLATPAFGNSSMDDAPVRGTDAQYGYDSIRGLTSSNPNSVTEDDQSSKPGRSKPNKKQRKLLYIRVFPETLAQITQFDGDPASSRFGQPTMYSITFNDPRQSQTAGIGLTTSTRNVHWSRVVHIVDTSHQANSSEVFNASRMRVPYNILMNLLKVYGGSGEGYWKSVFAGLSLETHPQLGGDVNIDQTKLAAMMNDYQNTLQRWIALTGMSAKSLAPTMTDPTPYIAVYIEAICIKIGCPVRVFKGSERGELASSQDDSSWNDRLGGRQKNYITPKIVIPFVNRLINLEVLPEPKGVSVDWPSLESLTDAEKAAVAQTKTATLVSYVTSGLETIYPFLNFLTTIMGMDEEEAQAIIDSAKKDTEDTVSSDLLQASGGIMGLTKLFDELSAGVISEETFKQILMLFYQVDEAKAEQILADTADLAAEKLAAEQEQQQMMMDQSQEQHDANIAAMEAPVGVANVFCATGQGGGIDPTCPAHSSSVYSSEQDPFNDSAVADFMDTLEETYGENNSSANEIGQALTLGKDVMIVKDKDGKLIGAMAYQDSLGGGSPTVYHMGSLAKGVGTYMIQKLKDDPKNRMIVADTAVKEAQGFYSKLGFEPIGDGSNMGWFRPRK